MKGEAVYYGLLLVALGIAAVTQTGCMQLTGAKRINAWGLEIESNSGFEVSGGVMQFDGADNRKTMNRNNVTGGGKY